MASPEPIAGRCGAVVKPKPEQGREGGFCEKHPLAGQSRCGTHGGKAPQALAAAERRQAEDSARAAVATYGLRRDVEPREALLEEMQWTAGHVAWLRLQVQQLAPDDLVWGTTEEKDVGSGERPGLDVTQAAKPSVWWDLYMQERKLLLALLKEAREARIEERRIELAERQGALVADVIRAVLRDLGHDLTDPAVLRVVSTQLRALGAEPA